MSKIKKVLAVFLTLAMVMGMGLTSFAADSAKIVINNAGGDATFSYLQVIKSDPTKETGWDFTDSAIEKIYVNAFTSEGVGEPTGQQVIGFLKSNGADTAYATQIASALEAVIKSGYFTAEATKGATTPISVNAAGVYAIQGTETGYNYSPMAAYVGFAYSDNGQQDGVVESVNVNAKKAPSTVVKESDDEADVTEIGRTEGFTITGIVPYLPANATNVSYVFKDTLTGARYNTETEGDNTGLLKVTVTVDGDNGFTKDYYVQVENNSFSLDLKGDVLSTANTHQDRTITLKYEAIVTDVEVGNTVLVGDGSSAGENKYGFDDSKLYTGEITLTKYGEEETVVLQGAKFVMYKGTGDSTEYAKFENGLFAGWVKELEKASELTTDEKGQFLVKGLELGTYYFKETKAPEGYSINATDSEAILTLEGNETVATKIFNATTEMKDTKLSSLPSTGGIGTTIFTIGGCLIMIIAAALFFASRRKNNK